MQDIRADEQFLRHAHHLVFAVFVEYDDVVYIRAVAEELVFLQPCPHKALRAVDIEFLVGFHHGLHIDVREVTHLRPARVFLPVFLAQHLEPLYRVFRQVRQVLLTGFYLLLEVAHQLIRLLRVELRDTNHPYLKQFLDILLPYFAYQLRFPRRQGFVHKRNQLLLVRRRLVALFLIDSVLNKYLL